MITSAQILMIVFVLAVSVIASARLLSKGNQPVWMALLPGFNLVAGMRMIGRPDHHALWILVPGVNIYFFFKWHAELAQSFGKTKPVDMVFAVVFNLFYVLNLGLAYNEKYVGPVYNGSAANDNAFA